MEGGEQMGRLQSGRQVKSLGLTFSLAHRPGPLSLRKMSPCNCKCDRVLAQGGPCRQTEQNGPVHTFYRIFVRMYPCSNST